MEELIRIRNEVVDAWKERDRKKVRELIIETYDITQDAKVLQLLRRRPRKFENVIIHWIKPLLYYLDNLIEQVEIYTSLRREIEKSSESPEDIGGKEEKD